MKYNLYAVADAKSSKSDLFLSESDLTARRDFEFALKTDMKKAMFPGDFTLYKLGSYDYDTLEIKVDKDKTVIMNGVAAIGSEAQNEV